MEVSLILGGLGTALGIGNLVYWGWWVRREVVKLQNQHIDIKVIEREGLEPPHVGQMTGIWVEATFELMQTSGHKSCCIRACHLQLDKQLCSELEKWFDMPADGKIEATAGYAVDFLSSEVFAGLEYKPKEFSIRGRFERKQSMIDLYSSWTTQTVKEVEEIKSKVEQLKARYTMGYTRSDGKVRNWRFG